MNEMNDKDAISFLLLYKGALAALNARGSLILANILFLFRQHNFSTP